MTPAHHVSQYVHRKHDRTTGNKWMFLVALFIVLLVEISTLATAFAATSSNAVPKQSKSVKIVMDNHKQSRFLLLRQQQQQRERKVLSSSRITNTGLSMSIRNELSLLRGGGTFLENTPLPIGTSTPSLLFNTVFGSLVLLTVLAKLAQRISESNSATFEKYNSSFTKTHGKPAFVKSLQIRFLIVFWLLRCSDWLQGPYFYEVYASKLVNGATVSMALVSRLFLTGFASTALFGPAAGNAADQYGRKKATIAFSIIYAVGALSTKSTVLLVLFLGRIVSGIGTSLLFSAPESWLVGESQKKTIVDNGKKEEDASAYLGETFGLAYAGDSVVAITAGQMAGMAAHARGPTGPFELSTIFLGIGGLLTAILWKENKAEQTNKQIEKNSSKQDKSTTTTSKSSTREAFEICLNDPKIMFVGAVQSLFEAAMYIFVMQWPPAMSAAISKVYSGGGTVSTPYGSIFSCFMACCLLGSTLFGQLTKMSVPTEQFTSAFLAVATVAMSTSAWNVLQSSSTTLSLPILTISFFAFEAAVGMYFPSIGTLRSRFVPDSHRSLIMNLFGIPLNILVCSVFLSIQKLGVGGALCVSSAALGLATLCMLQLQRIVSKEEKKKADA